MLLMVYLQIQHMIFLKVFCIDFMSNLIVHYINSKKFNLQDLNNAISSFDYSDIDKNNKPQCFKEKPLTQFRIKLTTCEMWNFMRLFPLMMGSYVDKLDPAWDLLGQLITIIERICSVRFKEVDLVYFEYYINEFFKDY